MHGASTLLRNRNRPIRPENLETPERPAMTRCLFNKHSRLLNGREKEAAIGGKGKIR